MPNAPDRAALRAAFGAFATGVTVVAARLPDGRMAGFTANSFCSVSLDPPLLLVCLGHDAHSAPLFAEIDGFAVSVLAADQQDVAATFATSGADKFRDAPWRLSPGGAPVVEGALAAFDCALHQRVEAGDHAILIGRVLGLESRPGAPLLYHRGDYAALSVL